MVYPEGAKTKGIVTKVVNFFVGQSSKEEALYVPDHDTMQEKALEIFLENYRSNLVNLELSHHLDIVQIAKRITHIFRQLYIQRISQSRDQIWVAGKLPAVSMSYTIIYSMQLYCVCVLLLLSSTFCVYFESLYFYIYSGNESMASVSCRRSGGN